MDEAPEDSYFLPFLDNWFWRGARMFHCRTQKDVKWLKNKVGGCVHWTCASLKAVEMGDLPKLPRVNLCPREARCRDGPEKAVAAEPRPEGGYLAGQELQGSSRQEKRSRSTMEPTEVEALKRIDFLPYCGGFRAHYLEWKYKDVTKDGGTTDNMEVNTPASDKEERPDRDGGPSDNKERPTTPKEGNLRDL